jgi:hypothetical protein
MKYKEWTLDQKLEICSSTEEIGVDASNYYQINNSGNAGCQ